VGGGSGPLIRVASPHPEAILADFVDSGDFYGSSEVQGEPNLRGNSVKRRSVEGARLICHCQIGHVGEM